MSREAELRHDLQRPLAQGDAVVRSETHVSPVKPLHAGGPRGAAVHLDGRSGLRGYYAPRSAACPRQTAAVRADAS